jgi:MFS family permease
VPGTTPHPPARGRGPAALAHRLRSHPRHRTFLLVTCLVGMFTTTFPVTILAVSLKRIADDLGSTPSTIAWATTAPMLAAAVATPILGRLGDLRGHRRVYLIGFTISTAFAALTAIAPGPSTLIGFRTLAQLAGAATVPASLAMLFRTVSADERMKVSAWTSSTLAGAAVTGLVVGGPLTELFGWRFIFVAQAVLSVVALVPAVFVLRPQDEVRLLGRIDWPGAALLAVVAFTATFGVNRLPVWGPTPLVVALLLVFPVALYAFIRVERRTATPILPLGMFASREVRLVILVTFLVGAAWAGCFIVTPILMQAVIGLSVGASSIASFPRATFISLSAPVASRLGMRYGERKVLVVALVALSATLGLLAVGAAAESIVVVVIAIAAGGWTFGHVQPALLSMISGGVAEEDVGLATSLQQTANQIGSVFGSGLLSAIAADATTPGPFVGSYLLAGGLALVAAGIAIAARDTDRVVGGMVAEDEMMEPVPVLPEQVLHR